MDMWGEPGPRGVIVNTPLPPWQRGHAGRRYDTDDSYKSGFERAQDDARVAHEAYGDIGQGEDDPDDWSPV